MSDPGAPELDWEEIFGRAHRRLIVRLALLAALGGVGALLLLSGGLTAEGSVKLGLGPFGKQKVAKKTPRLKVDPKVEAEWQPPPPTEALPVTRPPKAPNPQPPAVVPPPPPPISPPSCPKGEAYDEQYSDCVPRLPDAPEEPEGSAADIPGSTNGGIESPAEAGAIAVERSDPTDAIPEAETAK
jgi:hypothetical protein